ncbi:alpha/beta fold hydrolase [Streptomyces sp. NPDC096132]|uniref:alpha/beta fold hydrolase n=1 Tax=Streptomyces sp. NPDC096132 TaxID=3366075 RepID=UPI003803DF9A
MHTIKANGVLLAYRVRGPEDAPPVLLLHCRGADGADWTTVAERLASEPGARRVYAPDLRGHGHSERLGDTPGAYGYEAMSDDMRELLAALGIERADVVGHSLGGIVAYLLAQRSPDVVRRLVLEDVPAPFPFDPPRPPTPRPDGELSFDWAMVPATDAQANRPDPVWWERMARIAAPTLVVSGGPASHVPQDRVTAVAERIPGARLVTVDAGHLVHETRPQEFLEAVEGFLAE